MKTTLLAIVLASAAFAQPPDGGPPGAPPTDAIKAYLSLTDAQITSLESLRTQEGTAMRTVGGDIATKQKSLNDQLTAGVTDPAALGKLVLDIYNLRKQLDTMRTGYQTQAVALLTADQKTKLKALSDAVALQRSIQQAVGLNLLAPPAGGPGGGPGPAGMGGAPMGMGGPGGGFAPMRRPGGPPL